MGQKYQNTDYVSLHQCCAAQKKKERKKYRENGFIRTATEKKYSNHPFPNGNYRPKYVTNMNG
jgi:hypothetical protein